MGAGESAIERPIDERPMDESPLDGRPMDERLMEKLPTGELPIEGPPVEEFAVEELAIEELAMAELAMAELAVQELAMEERPLPAVPPLPTAHGRRRLKSALFVGCCGLAGVAPHLAPAPANLLPAISLSLFLGGYSLRTVVLALLRQTSEDRQGTKEAAACPPPTPLASLPSVDVVVAARDEQAVITRLVERLALLRYPSELLTLWVIDDGSSDRTPELLAELQGRHPQLRVLRREPNAGGGKSGALNLALQHLRGRWMLVLDADAELQADTLERLMPFAEAGPASQAGPWAAVQLRKAVVNPQVNLLTRAQAMEMVLDAVIQQGRLAHGGVSELRGNGQLLLRQAIDAAGGFNEDTVTDDLDLSFRLLLAGLPVGGLWDPPVREEAVLGLRALLRQRQRWAEGGLQRFFDYWPGLISSRLTGAQRLDLACFFLLQYSLPVVAIADLFGAAITHSQPTIWPLSFVAFGLSGASIWGGCRRRSEGPPLPAMTPLNLMLGILYLGHWFVVIPWTSMRMALRPKQLIWVKTTHLGEELQEEFQSVDSGALALGSSLDQGAANPAGSNQASTNSADFNNSADVNNFALNDGAVEDAAAI
jgi:1,2-diacylglycerol 3-beta-glucosyltransferase